tara:strand:- start:1388 stop:2134 length:747 start_codon:yes stop_codon:yes gene_type:complete
MSRLVIFGGSYAESNSHADQTAWQHQVANRLGMDMVNHALPGTSVRWSLNKLINYLNTDHRVNDHILFFVSDHDSLPFMDTEGRPEWASNLSAWILGTLDPKHPAHRYFDDRADTMRWIHQHYQEHHADCKLIQSFLFHMPNTAWAIPCTDDGYNWPYEYHMGDCHDDHTRTRIKHLQGASTLHRRYTAEGETTHVLHNHMIPERHRVFAQHILQLLQTNDPNALKIEDMREVSRKSMQHDPSGPYPI